MIRLLSLFVCLLWATDSDAGKWFKRKHSRSAGACAGGVCTTEMGQTPPVDSSHTTPPATSTAVKVGDTIDVIWATRTPPAVGAFVLQTGNGNWRLWRRDIDRRDIAMEGTYLGNSRVKVNWINPVPPRPFESVPVAPGVTKQTIVAPSAPGAVRPQNTNIDPMRAPGYIKQKTVVRP